MALTGELAAVVVIATLRRSAAMNKQDHRQFGGGLYLRGVYIEIKTIFVVVRQAAVGAQLVNLCALCPKLHRREDAFPGDVLHRRPPAQIANWRCRVGDSKECVDAVIID